MSKRKPIPLEEVLGWLKTNHPELHLTCEVDRSWCWTTENLRDKPLVRESLKAYGFIFHRRGGHPLPGGKLGVWGHACMKPLGFHKKTKLPKTNGTQPESESELSPEERAMLLT